ncbi:NAD(P)H dehydrogenase [Paenibacillus naphthalenovorans]|uniref:NAD(P)H dehydrogenase n=2 Tax=Paenibacillus TaxID=44249 RepID=A0A0U2W1X7_9BACL|nr:NAD(P)H dehydrogenase [Paenibacillus naphthalenovorans]SDH85308.1 Putative NADPH-quinone reductase (modulator of drug activity B) [Paenibacillus naphthalenovorans]
MNRKAPVPLAARPVRFTKICRGVTDMKVLTIVSHPRRESLTFSVAERFVQGLTDAGHEVEMADLYGEEFHPLVFEKDEPDWDNPRKSYSARVQAEMERLKRNEGLAFIFPVWWYSLPAITKGYIDRTWNYGFAYGGARLPHKKVLWIPLVGETEASLKKRSFDTMISQYLNVGLAGYTGISQSEVAFFYNTLAEEMESEDEINKHYESLLQRAYELGQTYSDSVTQ